MADDVIFQSAVLATIPDGSIVAADRVANVIYQRVKVVWGADGVVTDASATNPLPVVLATGAAVIGHVITDTGSTTVVTGTVTTKETRSSTGTPANVASSNTSVTVLAANANRLGATVTNDSTAILYLLLATSAASTSNYTVQLAGSTTGGVAYYEVPFNYTGQLTGIWASANGNARVTELTA